MDWLTTDPKNVTSLILMISLALLAFGWSAIFWYAARTLEKLRESVEGLHGSVRELFVQLGGQGDDLKDLKNRVTHLERRR